MGLAAIALPLFVPADRSDRFTKAFTSGADAVILDLEDAVSPDRKGVARDTLARERDLVAGATCPVLLRVNAIGTVWHDDDMALAAAVPLAGLILPKAESAGHVAEAQRRLGIPVVALIESARGLAAVRETAHAAARLAFGSIDFASDLGCAHTRETLLVARGDLVLASRLAGLAGPLDGVTATLGDAALVENDARYASSLGFAGKLLIHPSQIAPARSGFMPSPADQAWAERVLAAGVEGGAVAVDGSMVDAPVRLRAQDIMRRAAAREGGSR